MCFLLLLTMLFCMSFITYFLYEAIECKSIYLNLTLISTFLLGSTIGMLITYLIIKK